jgi:hypothetical protein
VERVARDMDAWLDACVHASGNMRQQSAAELLLLIFFNISIDSIVWNLDDHPENSG